LNSMPMVSESLVLQQGDRLVALVVPDKDETKDFTPEEIEAVMEQNRQNVNQILPTYSRLSKLKLHDEEFQKTPKKSIKRYLYQA